MEPVFIEEDEEEFEGEAEFQARAFIIYSKYPTFDNLRIGLKNKGLIISTEGNCIEKIDNEQIKYNIDIENPHPFIWKFSTKESKGSPFKRLYNILNSDMNFFTAWLPSKYFKEAEENFANKYTFEPTGFSLKYHPYLLSEYYTRITLRVWSKNAEKYRNLLKTSFKGTLGIDLKEYYSQSRITSLNPSKTGQVNLRDDLTISQMNGNCYDVFDDICKWGNNKGDFLLKKASNYSWYEIKSPTNSSNQLVERRTKKALELSFDSIDRGKLEDLTGASSLGKLYIKHFSPKMFGDSVRFPKEFIASSIEEYKNQIILRLLNFLKGETLIMDINEKDWTAQLYPTDLTNPWTVINIYKEIYDVYPLEVKGFP